MLKNFLKSIIVAIVWHYTKRYQQKFKPVVIGVAGSVGKTGTKRAIAKTLSTGKRVAWQDGNYNDIVTVPLVFFGLQEPSVFNPLAWLKTINKMRAGLKTTSPAEVVVLELGTDGPGQIDAFNGRLRLDYAVVTAISFEHMLNFESIEAVAKEELAIANYSSKLYLGRQIAEEGFTDLIGESTSYQIYGASSKDASASSADNKLTFSQDGSGIKIHTTSNMYKIKPSLVGVHQYNSLVISAELAEKLGMGKAEVLEGLESIQPMPGRMQLLDGKDSSLIIDDSYNASPDAVVAALDYLYSLKGQQYKKIAVLGNMNEMGQLSESVHTQVGEYCDPKQLELVITIGPDANKHLAEAAKSKGCQVKTFDSPVELGEFLASLDLSGHCILFKGSQNGVFVEEAIKFVLKNPEDRSKLVRQSDYWLHVKAKQFSGIK